MKRRVKIPETTPTSLSEDMLNPTNVESSPALAHTVVTTGNKDVVVVSKIVVLAAEVETTVVVEVRIVLVVVVVEVL